MFLQRIPCRNGLSSNSRGGGWVSKSTDRKLTAKGSFYPSNKLKVKVSLELNIMMKIR